MKRHRLDLVSAFFGIVFLGLGLTILGGNGSVSLRYLTVLGPILLVALGIVLVAAAIRRPRPAVQQAQAAAEPPASYSYASYTAPLERSAAHGGEAPEEGSASDEDLVPFDPDDET